ncbi:YopX family protein [Lysinibacillus sp. CTST325]
MSREIKFRAWDKTYNFMSYKVLVGNTDSKDENYTAHCMWIEPENVDYDREPGWMHFDEHSDVILMQYTGLKDKNGKEIYERDIVKVEIPVVSVNEDFIGRVEMFEGRWWIDNGCDAIPLWSETNEISVLGNIFENLELLEVLI